MMALFDEKKIQEMYGEEKREEGRVEGRDEERFKNIIGLKKIHISDEQIAEAFNISIEVVRSVTL